jgi:predicted RNA binding protein YcfA (HicA-like mRNA interferase family)
VKFRELIRLLEDDGWKLVAQRGSHQQYEHPSKPGKVTVAGKPERPLMDETVRRVGGDRPIMVGDRLDTDIEGAHAISAPSLLVLTGVRPNFAWLLVVPLVVLQTIFNLGLAMATARLTFHFRDVQQVLPYLLRIWFYMSGVIFPVAAAPARLQPWLELNPAYVFVEIGREASVAVEEVMLTPKRDVRRVQGYLHELLNNPDDYGPREDYVMAELLDEGAVYDPIGRLREVFPNVLDLRRPKLIANDQRRRSTIDLAGKSNLELFQDFMTSMTGKEMTDEQQSEFIDVSEEVRRREQEMGQ